MFDRYKGLEIVCKIFYENSSDFVSEERDAIINIIVCVSDNFQKTEYILSEKQKNKFTVGSSLSLYPPFLF